MTEALVARAPIVYPFDYIDKGGLAVTDNARGCSGTPTWQLVVRGALDAGPRARRARRRGRALSVVALPRAPLDGADAARARAASPGPRIPPSPSTASSAPSTRAIPTRSPRSCARSRIARSISFADFPVTLTLARTGDDSCRLFFRQHHAIADGRAFIGLLADFAAFLDAARAGRRPAAGGAGADRPRRASWPPLGLTPAAPLRLAPRRLRHARRPGRARAVPPDGAAALQNRSNDYRGDNGTVHLVLDDAILEPWNAARKRIGVSLNSLLTAAFFAAVARWHRARGAPVGRTTVDADHGDAPARRRLRLVRQPPRDARRELWRSIASSDPPSLARAVQAQVDAQRRANRPFKRLLAERALVAGMTLGAMQRIVFESKHPSYNLSFSNLIALEFPALAGDGWRVEEVLITTPVTPRTGLVLTAIRYGGRLVFNFNYKSTAATRDDAAARLTRLRRRDGRSRRSAPVEHPGEVRPAERLLIAEQ